MRLDEPSWLSLEMNEESPKHGRTVFAVLFLAIGRMDTEERGSEGSSGQTDEE